jgi:hypothetical protein
LCVHGRVVGGFALLPEFELGSSQGGGVGLFCLPEVLVEVLHEVAGGLVVYAPEGDGDSECACIRSVRMASCLGPRGLVATVVRRMAIVLAEGRLVISWVVMKGL